MTADTLTAVQTQETREDVMQRFLDGAGWGNTRLKPLAGDASFRRYIRVEHGKKRTMLMDAPPEKENVRPYMTVARFLHAQGFSAPELIAVDPEHGFLLSEDLGDDLYSAVLRQSPECEQALYEAAIDMLAAWHTTSAMRHEGAGITLPVYNEALLLQEASLLADWFLPAVMPDAGSRNLRESYINLWHEILSANPLDQQCFVHRDYHADNLMWLPEREGHARIGLLDFQDAVWGDGAYDVASLLEDARRDVPPALANAMITRYVHAANVDESRFRLHYDVLAAQRNCKIIGIFVRLYARDRKPVYLKFLPRVWRHLERDLQNPALGALKSWLDEHVPARLRGELSV